MDWTILAQLYRRGGLKSAKLIPPADVDDRVGVLRKQEAEAQAAKVAEGAKAPKADPKRGGELTVPDEYQWFETSAREQVLGEHNPGGNFRKSYLV